MFNAKKTLNGLTVEIYHKMRNEGNSNGKIQRHFKLNNAVYYGWKKENGLTDAAMAAKISNGAKGVKKQGDKKKMMATAIKPATSASQVSKMDKVITDLEQTVESYKQQVSSRDQEIKRLQKQADQKHISYEEAVATLNETWENKVLEKESVINQLQTEIKHKDSNVKYVKEQFAAVVNDRDNVIDKVQTLQKELNTMVSRYTNLEEDYNSRNESYERVLKEKHQLSERYDHLDEEAQRTHAEAVELKRLYEEQLQRANELEAANLSYKQELEEAYECNDNKQKTLDAFEEANDILARKHKEMNKNFDDLLDKVSANDRVHQEEVKMLHDKIEKLQGTLKLYL